MENWLRAIIMYNVLSTLRTLYVPCVLGLSMQSTFQNIHNNVSKLT